MSLEIKNKAILFPNIGKLSIAIFGLLLIFSGMRAFELFDIYSNLIFLKMCYLH
jgi:hypothetical protein